MSELTYSGVELRPSSGKHYFWISRGFDEKAQVRGVDSVIVGRAGRDVRPRHSDVLRIELTGWVIGLGATEEAARADYRATLDALLVAFNPALDPANLIVYSPTMGVPTGKKRTVTARTLNLLWGPWVAGLKRNVSVEMECVDYPPAWVEDDI